MNQVREPAVVEFESVSFAYGDRLVLEDVSFSLGRGEFLAVLGPNGGGKTTLVKLALGLLTPDAGRVRVFGLPPGRTSGRIGYVPQRGEVRGGFPVTVLDAVRMGLPRTESGPALWFRGGDARRREREAALAALERVGLEGRARQRFNDLSGGQQQRVLIARALAGRAELLILDEPTASVDPSGSFCFYDFLCGLGESERLTILSVSHDLTILATHVTAMATVNGRLIHNPAPELNPEMMTMLYGAHEHTCAMEDHMRRVSEILARRRGGDHAAHGDHSPGDPPSQGGPHA